jgi:D-cysteine desulfhydrase
VSEQRIPLATLPTPLVRARRLERTLGAGPLYVKRDDLTGFGVAGNKARALEFLLGAAVAERSDTFVTGGSSHSNFCTAAAMAAATTGIACDLLFAGNRDHSVNVELAVAAGARVQFAPGVRREDVDKAVFDHAEALRAQGKRPYAVPRGGATPIGAIGYAYAARELAQQCDQLRIAPQLVVLPTGSGVTQAGLVAGQVGFGLPWRVIGASVSRPVCDVTDRILHLAQACAVQLGLQQPDSSSVDVRDVRGDGFGVTSAADRDSAHVALLREGLLLDDYYGAKAMTLLRTLLTGTAATPAVYWHTGGIAAALTHGVWR